jgi:hypothetical protein
MIWNQFTTKAAAMKVLTNNIDGLGNWPQVPQNNGKSLFVIFYEGFFICS